ncbi:MAG: bifunctional phosphopantothenoylcysteine decarboxylase/phosphopantothenate--cysteine ligase CoaBC [Balneolaceae bacterium]
MDLSGNNILLGVTGGIAAYKSANLLRDFQKAGADVRVTMTPSATRFVGSETFSTLSRHRVAIDVFNENRSGDSWTQHIHWGEWADIFIVAPCTANTLAKLVNGQADNMLTSVALAARCPLLLCPTMDAEMIRHPAVKKNLQAAEDYGFHLILPESGYLASGMEGAGRLPGADSILQRTIQILEESRGQGPLSKKKILVTAGPTREHIDPVRYISNPSSGKMGIAMAEAARKLGGTVTLLHGPIPSGIPADIDSEAFVSAGDLFRLVKKHADADVVVMSAAVADFRPATRTSQKIKKETADSSLHLTANPDSLAWLGKQKKNGQVLIGFAMETDEIEKNALAKLQKKNLDWICANDLTADDTGFQSDSNHILLFGKDGGKDIREEFTGNKREIAVRILRRIFG